MSYTSRDYARTTRKKSRQTKKEPSSHQATIWLVALVLLILFAAGLLYLNQHEDMQHRHEVPKSQTSHQNSEHIKKVKHQAAHQPAHQTHETKPKFEFYNILPNMNVAVHDEQQNKNQGNKNSENKIPENKNPENKVQTKSDEKVTEKAQEKPSEPENHEQSQAALEKQDNVVSQSDEKKNEKKDEKKSQKYLLQVACMKDYADADRLKAQLTLSGFEVNIEKSSNQQESLYRVQIGPYSSYAAAKASQAELAKNHYDSVIKKIES